MNAKRAKAQAKSWQSPATCKRAGDLETAMSERRWWSVMNVTERVRWGMSELSGIQKSILRHAVGVNHEGKGNPHRNHYAPGRMDIENCMLLEAKGLMVKGVPYHDYNYYHVTRSGCDAINLTKRQAKMALEVGNE